MSEVTTLHTAAVAAYDRDERALAYAEALVELLITHGLHDAVYLAHPKSWSHGVLRAQSDNPYTRALGYTIMLSAALETPGIAVKLLASVRDAAQGIFDQVDDDDAA